MTSNCNRTLQPKTR